MIATMDRHAVYALRAASWIAGQQWDGKLQFERKGETMVIAGTDNYVYACIEVDATFCGWDDGDVVALIATRPFMRFCKLAYDWCWHRLNMSLTVEFSPVFETVTITITNRDDAPDALSMLLPTINERIHAEKFDDMPEGQNEGHMAITSSTWRRIDKLVNILGCPYDAWVFHDRGPLHAFDLTCKELRARIIAMPTKECE